MAKIREDRKFIPNQYWTASPDFKKLTRRPWEIYILILALVIIFFLMYTRKAESQDQLTGTTIIDHDNERIIHNEVGLSATVEPSDCLTCLKSFTLDECKLIYLCLLVNEN